MGQCLRIAPTLKIHERGNRERTLVRSPQDKNRLCTEFVGIRNSSSGSNFLQLTKPNQDQTQLRRLHKNPQIYLERRTLCANHYDAARHLTTMQFARVLV
jgi:hypothetical protein